jgi:hypothetical protein
LSPQKAPGGRTKDSNQDGPWSSCEASFTLRSERDSKGRRCSALPAGCLIQSKFRVGKTYG